jgi:hypothetical protein
MSRKLLTLVVVGLFAACGFPQVSYDTGDGGGGNPGDGSSHTDGGSGDDTTVEGAAGEGGGEGGGETGPGTDGSSSGGDSTTSDGSSDAPYVFEAAVDAPVCDQDEDTYDLKGSTCGGLDCDDTDKHANPGVTTFQTYAPHPPSNGDWNCDGIVETQFPTSFNCGLLGSSSCAGKSGFTDAPGCGATSTKFITCKVSTGLLCVTDTTGSNTQGCM